MPTARGTRSLRSLGASADCRQPDGARDQSSSGPHQADQSIAYCNQRQQREGDGDRGPAADAPQAAQIDRKAERRHRQDRQDCRDALDEGQGGFGNEPYRAQRGERQKAEDEPGSETLQRRARGRTGVSVSLARGVLQQRHAEEDRAESQHADQLHHRADLHAQRCDRDGGGENLWHGV